MPALVLFERRWLLASDDVPAPAAVLAVFHLVWLALLAAWAAEIHGPEDCEGVGKYYVAVGGLMGSFLLSLVLEVAAVAVGLRGSLFETRRRAALPALLYANAASMAAQAAFNGYATHLIYTDPPRCAASGPELWDPIDVFRGLVWCTWAAILGLLALVVVTYNLFPDYRDPKQWERRCACLGLACCGARRGRLAGAGAAKRLGGISALLFGHVDWTMTDMAVAFGLALQLQRMHRRRVERVRTAAAERRRSAAAGGSGGSSPGSDDGLLDHAELGTAGGPGSAKAPPSDESASVGAQTPGEAGGAELAPRHLGLVDADTLAEAAHYMKFAFAAYGWMLFVLDRRAAGVAELCCGRACGLWVNAATGRHGRPRGLLAAPYVNAEATLQAAGLADEDLVCVRHEGHAPDVLPYFLAVDRARRTVVLAIRGSLSIDDVVRDLLFEPSDVDAWVQGGRAWGDPLPPLRPAAAATRFAAHAGILEAARATLDDVRAGGHLLDLLHGPTARCAGYRLVVAGHSLGAGVAFLASLHLRHYFPGLRCFAFSPPGGLATAELCAGAAGWCTSSVCGKEWIPRLTVATFERMRDGMVMAAARCRRPKLAVAWGWARGRAWRERELFYAPGDVPDEPMDWLRRYEASLEATRAARGWAERAANFGPPGRVMHLRPTGVVGPRADAAADGGAAGTRKRGGKGGGTARQYTAVWVDSQAVVDEGILLSSRMMADHMPDYCLAVLRRLADAAARHQAAAEVADAGGRGAVEGAVSLAQAVAAGRAHSATDAGEHGHPPGRGGPRERGRREE